MTNTSPEIQALERKMQENEAQESESKRKIAIKRPNLTTLEGTIQRLKQEQEKIKSRISQIKTEGEDLGKKQVDNERNLGKLDKEKTALEKEIAELETSISQAEHENGTIKQNMQRLIK